MYLAVARAVERPHRGLARAACGRRRVREHHERRRLVLRVQLGVEHARPRALDIAEHLARKHRARVVRRLALPLRGAGCACCWRPCSADAPSSITRGSIPKKYDAANATTIVPMPIVAPRPPPNPPAPRRSSTFVLSLSSSSLIAGPPCSCRWSGTRARNRAIGCRDTIPGRCNARARGVRCCRDRRPAAPLARRNRPAGAPRVDARPARAILPGFRDLSQNVEDRAIRRRTSSAFAKWPATAPAARMPPAFILSADTGARRRRLK